MIAWYATIGIWMGKPYIHDVSRDKLTYDLDLHGKMQFADNGDVVFYLNYPEQSLQSGKLLNGEPLTLS